MTITIIGKNSYLGRSLAEHAGGPDWQFLSHDEAFERTDWLESTRTVFNLAYHPDLKTGRYDPDKDIDRKLAEKVAEKDIHYVMASSRLVYGFAPDDLILREDMEPAPETPYAKNKYETEKALAEILPPERLTILRMGNIIGFEPGRKSFMGQALTKLQEDGRMEFDIAPDAIRDFLPVTYWAEIVSAVLQAPKPGIFNVGSGLGTTTDDIASWLMEARGQGRAHYTALSYDGQFILDMSKTSAAYEFEAVSKALLKIYVQSLGRRLKQAA